MASGIDLAGDEGDQVGRSETAGDVRTQRLATARRRRGDGRRHSRRPGCPIVADPDGALAAKMGAQVEHVVDAVFERVIGMAAVGRGTSSAT
jgi:hypothetical protein